MSLGALSQARCGRPTSLLIGLASLLWSAGVAAQPAEPPDEPAAPLSSSVLLMGQEHIKIIEEGQKFQALGSDLFGDQTSFYTGTTEFVTTDVSLPGNSSLPVAVARRFVVQNRAQRVDPDNAFADWELDIPWIEGTFVSKETPAIPRVPGVPGGWVLPQNGGEYTDQRCSRPNAADSTPPNHRRALRTYFPRDYWHGYQLHVPGSGDQDLLVNDAANSFVPTTGETFYWSTREQWHITCGVQANPGSSETGEGFVALAPDGTRYTFNHFVRRSAEAIRAPAAPGSAEETLIRTRILAYPSKVIDRFGNEVQYIWSGSFLVQIRGVGAGETRTLTLTYETVDGRTRVKSVSDGSRTWSYAYKSQGVSGTPPLLAGVTLPDNTAWTINFASLTGRMILYNEQGHMDFASCYSAGELVKGLTFTGTLTHPSGATGSFTFRPTRHFRSNLPVYAENCYSTGSGPAFPVTVLHDDVAFAPYSSDVPSLISKTVSGVALTTRSWQLSYLGGGVKEGPCESQSECVQTTEVYGPDSILDRYVFSNRARLDEGKLVRHDRGTSSGTVLTSDVMSYALTPPSGSSYTHRLGTNPARRGDTAAQMDANNFPSEHIVPMTSRVTTRQGVNFTWNASAFERSVNPTSITKSSALGSKTETLTYLNDTSKWVLGLPLTLSTNGFAESSTAYDPVLRLPISESSFGRVVRTGEWNTDGTLKTVSDARGNRTRFQSYYRGIPQFVTYAEGSTEQADEQASVNNIGRITSTTDELGSTTNYGYDAMGRLSRIDYPVGDSTHWLPTTISYGPIGAVEYGIPAGHWKRTESAGNRQTNTYYDALFQPILEERFDAANPAGSRSLVRKDFDSSGQVTFASYPVRSATSYTNITSGVRSGFDTIDRPVWVSADSELGALGTTIEYLPGFQRKTTNPRLQSITESFQAFDTPDMGSAVQRQEPLGVTIDIGRDVWGKPLTVTRSGSAGFGYQSLTRRMVYDSYQRLCKRIDPESNAAYLEYDPADNLAWSATGIAQLQPTCDRHLVPEDRKVTYAHDARNRRLRTDMVNPFPAQNQGQGFNHHIVNTYFADGALKSTSTQGSTRTYGYNKRRLPVSETVQMALQTGTRTNALGWGYSPNGDLASAHYPDGYVVTYVPDALGRPTVVQGSDGRSFASGIGYHPSGSLAGFSYGNGIVHSTTQNLRQLPSNSRASLGIDTVLDYSLSYDANGNVTQILDGSPEPLETRQSITYDARDRLLSSYMPATKYGLALTEAYAYDALDNVRSLTHSGSGFSATQTHTVDAATNRLTSIHDGGAVALASYVYDSRGNVSNRVRRIVGATQSVTYTHVFDQLNRLGTTYRSGDGVSGEEFTTYDGHGRRTASDRRTGAGTPSYNVQVYSLAGELLYEEDERSPVSGAHPQSSNGKKVRHIYLGGSRIARQLTPIGSGTTQTLYAHTNPIRTTTVETDDFGRVVNTRLRLGPYGAPYSGEYHDRPGFTGHMTDDWTELTYAQQRYYDPVAARFLSADPVDVGTADGGNFNRYWYANNNPYKYTDPDGRSAAVLPAFVGGSFVCGPVCGSVAAAVVGISSAIVINEAIKDAAPEAGTAESDEGCIYCVRGANTSSGDDYIGSTDDLDARSKDKSDGRDRVGAEKVDTYKKGDRNDRRNKEQKAMNDRGGKEKLDNKRNEVAEEKWEDRGIEPPAKN